MSAYKIENMKYYKKFINSLCEVLPGIIHFHNEFYKQFDSRSSFDLQKKKSKYSTSYSYKEIMLNENDIGYILNICLDVDIDYQDSFISPDDNEIELCYGKPCGFIISNEYCNNLYGEYNFLNSEFKIDELNKTFILENKNDCNEMMFLLSLENPGTLSGDQLWEMLQCTRKLHDLPEFKDGYMKFYQDLERYHDFNKRFTLPNEF